MMLRPACFAILPSIVALLSACAPSGGSSLPTSACAPDVPSPFHVDRLQHMYEAFDAGQKAVGSDGLAQFPTEAVRGACNALDPVRAPLCYEGASAAYAELVQGVVQAHAADAAGLVTRFEATMAAVDPRWTSIHCRGAIGMVTNGDSVSEPLASLLTPRCRAFAAELLGRSKVPDPGDSLPCSTGPERDSATCRRAVDDLVGGARWEDACAGLAPGWLGIARAQDWCAYGFGRGVANTFPGQFERASRFCRGPHRAACLAGIGFVAIYLYPDRMEPALALASHLGGADQTGYLEGLANALQWRNRSDPNELRTWIASLRPADALLANQLRGAADHCGLFDFGDGVDCRWPEVPAQVGACAR